MMNKLDLVEQLSGFGLDTREAEVYLVLLSKGSLTPLVLSRETGINRTTLYRILENLEKLGLVKEVLGYKSTSYEASSGQNLANLISQKEIELNKLQKDFPTILAHLQSLPVEITGPTKILYYHGISGLRQLLWNTLSAQKQVVGFGYGDWNKGIGKVYAERLRQLYVERQIVGREILNEGQIDKSLSFTQNKEYLNHYYVHRIMSRRKLEINHDTYIYNDVFAFYHTYEGELFGVEIHNGEIAKTQRQIFNILWHIALPAK